MSGPIKHGMHKSPENAAWRKMKDRCYNPRSQRYDRYGARGITVCERWRDSFEAFYADMGPRPSPQHSIERKDNDGHYEPGNVRWATAAEQNANKSDNVYLEHDGKRLTMGQWCHLTGMNPKTLAHRIYAGWAVNEAITTPIASRTWTRSPGGPGGKIPMSNVVHVI